MATAVDFRSSVRLISLTRSTWMWMWMLTMTDLLRGLRIIRACRWHELFEQALSVGCWVVTSADARAGADAQLRGERRVESEFSESFCDQVGTPGRHHDPGLVIHDEFRDAG